MEDSGLKQRWLADRFGVHEVVLSRYMSGTHYPRNKRLRGKIAKFFNFSVDELFPRKQRKSVPDGYIEI